MNPRNLFWLIFSISLVAKLLFAIYMPINTDEAYFVSWGKNLDYGYYDHPPMVGWLLWLMLKFSDAIWWIRLPTIVVTSLIGWGIYRVLRDKGERSAVFAASIYLLLPINLIAVLIATDTPLIFWIFLSVMAFYLAVRKDNINYFIMAGVCLGLAVLSKYFAALLGFAYLIYFLVYARNRTGMTRLFIIYVVTLPFIFINLYWNYNHCWTNYLFNFVNRHGSSDFSLNTVLTYWLMWVWLLPPLIYYTLKFHRRLSLQAVSPVFLIVFLVPLVLFAILSFVKEIGLHWILGFLPFVIILMGQLLSEQQLRTSLKFISVYGLLHIVVVVLVLSSPLSFIKPDNSLYKDIVLMFNASTAMDELKRHAGGYHITTQSYGPASVMSYYAGENVAVIGQGSHYARQDDLNTDYRLWQGENVLIFSYMKNSLQKFESLFRQHHYKTISVKGVEFYILLGQSFDYQEYKQQHLKPALRYYQIPAVLPVGECYYYNKYFTDTP